MKNTNRRVYLIRGIVQGVGFRPYVYRCATSLALSGYVLNSPKGVVVDIEGCRVDEFESMLLSDIPPLASITDISYTTEPIAGYTTFEIKSSQDSQTKSTLISPDIATCDDCIEDFRSDTRFANYFATNCTNCGPRYSIIDSLPYDRAGTSMARFEMCEDCKIDYNDPLNRRYHAQPISCNSCGPKLSDTIANTAKAIKDGKIVAIKSLGGFHIVCDATNDSTISRLRELKRRPTKPFAIMIKDTSHLDSIAIADTYELKTLSSSYRPIVVLTKSPSYHLSPLVAPSIDRIGIFLPYTPIHHMLFDYITTPIIATSANISSKPIIYNSQDIAKELSHIVDFVLDFDRDILNPIDDTLVQVVDGDIQMLRVARGVSPMSLSLEHKTHQKILALGANQKSTISIAFDNHIVASGYIGDLGNIETNEHYSSTIDKILSMYDFVPDVVVCDKHPEYESSKWAKEYATAHNIPLIQLQHHYSHALSVLAEHQIQSDVLAFCFDGTGLGDDGILWGGEVLVANSSSYDRVYHFKPIKLLGLEKAIKEPRRVALSMLFDKLSLDEIKSLDIDTITSFSDFELNMLYKSYQKDISTIDSTSVGRVFDAVASLSSAIQVQSYEGEAGLLVESMYDGDIDEILEYSIADGVIDIKIVEYLLDGGDMRVLPTLFINTLVAIIDDISSRYELDIALSGGVFQNKTLLSKTKSKISKRIYTNTITATNDSGISVGQAYYVMCNG
jgi:hydrogenase maturation protein HypF